MSAKDCVAQTTEHVEPKTVGELLDHKIALTRHHLERLCITKAKAETLQILDYQIELLREVLWS